MQLVIYNPAQPSALLLDFWLRNIEPLRRELLHPLLRHGDWFDSRWPWLVTHRTLNFDCFILKHNHELALVRHPNGQIIDVKLANLDLTEPSSRRASSPRTPSPTTKTKRLSKAERIAIEIEDFL